MFTGVWSSCLLYALGCACLCSLTHSPADGDDPFADDDGMRSGAATPPQTASPHCQICSGTGEAEALLRCDVCFSAIHRSCAGMGRQVYAWGRGFTCVTCRYEQLDCRSQCEQREETLRSRGWRAGSTEEAHEQRRTTESLLHLAISMESRLWADSTWTAYHRSVQRVLELETELGVPLLPMTGPSGHSRLMVLMAAVVRREGSWRAVRSVRSGVRAWHVMEGLPDPFTTPAARRLMTGIRREVTLASGQKRPLPIEWITAMVLLALDTTRISSRVGRRDAVWIILGFFGVRRHSEVYVDARDEKGLRRCDVTFFPATTTQRARVRLYIRRMKNDPFGKGHFVWLCDVTASGIPIYDILESYAADLGLPQSSEAPFLQSTKGKAEWRGTSFQYRSRLKDYLKWIGVPASEAKHYSTHSLRRGGVDHAYRTGVHYDLCNVHGSWLSGPAITLYRNPSPEQLLTVTEAM